MNSIIQQITDWLKGILVSGIMDNLTNTFSSVNDQVGQIATEVGKTPSNFMPAVFNMVRNLSESVIMPVAGILLTFIACYELIQLIISYNNLASFETWFIWKWIFKTFVAVELITHTFDITMAVFDVSQSVVRQAGGIIQGSTAVDASTLTTMQATLEANPMDINMNYSDDDNPIALKADFILSLCELIVGNKDGLRPVEKTVIDRCIRQIYQKYFENPGPENMPILGDLYQALLAQEEPEAKHVATALEIYVSGSLNVFNHRTNVELTNRLVCYDIKDLGKQLKKIGMLVVQDQVWGRVTENRSQGRSTRYYMDEMHLLLREDQTAAYTVEIWKRFRKWGGIPTGITQNVKDLLASKEVENIFENSDFIYMLNQAVGDRQILAKQLNISPHQLSYVTHSGEGEGLLFYGNVILPFVDRFPTNTELYRIMTTRLSEVAEAKKAQPA